MGRPQRGTGQIESTRKTYLSFMGGKFVKRVDEAQPDDKFYRQRKLTKGPNEGQMVHEIAYPDICGRVLSIEKEIHQKFGASYAVTMDTSTIEGTEDLHVLKLSYSSSEATVFLSKLKNIDLSEDVVLIGYNFRPEDSVKDKIGFYVLQYDDATGKKEKVFSFYTEDNPNGMPKMGTKMDNGVEKPDFSAIQSFLENMLVTEIQPKLQALNSDNKQEEQDKPLEAKGLETESKKEEELPAWVNHGGSADPSDSLPY